MKTWVPLTVLALVLAGCSDGSSGKKDDFEDAFDDLDTDADSGLIRGVVFDASITPIPDATVAVRNAEVETTTNEDGAFVLTDLDPGSYFLDVSKEGFRSIQTSTEVKAGIDKPPIVRVQLEALPSAEPEVVYASFDGYIGCSVQAANFVDSNTCGWIYPVDPDQHQQFDFVRSDMPVASQTELVWEYTQSFGERLSVIQCMVDGGSCGIGGEGRMGNYWGPSPLICRNNATMGCGNDDGTGGGVGFETSGFTGIIEVNAYANCYSTCLDLRPAGSPGGIGATAIGAGFVMQQEYTMYATLFYNVEPDEEWTFFHDGEYVL